MRSFQITLDGKEVDTVCFIGEEYTTERVYEFMTTTEHMPSRIKIKLLAEMQKP